MNYLRSGRSFRQRQLGLGLTVAVGVCVASSALAAPQPCAKCERSLTLTAAQWRCVKEQIAYYASRKIDPVRVPTVGCGPVRTRTGRLPDTKIRADGKGAPSAVRPLPPLVVLLSRGQVRCLQRNAKLLDRAERRSGTRREALNLVPLCGQPVIGSAE